MGVEGFPTLKIVKPGSKPGRPVVEDYRGPRSAKAIVDTVIDKIPNHVKRLQSVGLDEWLADGATQAKAILFTEKGTTAALIKALAVDFLGSISFAQVRSKEKAAVEQYGITDFPSIVLLPGNGQEPIVYDGEMKKEPLVAFFSRIASPNPDPAPKKPKQPKASKNAKSAAPSSPTASSAFSRASQAHKASDHDKFTGEASTVILNDDTPTESPLPIVESDETPMVPDMIPALPMLSTPAELAEACLAPRRGNCILVLLPRGTGPEAVLPGSAVHALTGLAEISHRFNKRKAKIFPFFGVPADNDAANTIRDDLKLVSDQDLEVIAVNVKRGWWKRYTGEDYDLVSLESFVDEIKLGEGSKQKLPPGFAGVKPQGDAGAEIVLDTDTATEKTASEPEPESESEPEPTSNHGHSEL